MIEGRDPTDWRGLQEAVARILRECGCQAATDRQITIARGAVNVDVLARDATIVPPSLVVCECKFWRARVSKSVVHAFRTVVIDCGADVGLLISSAGFHRGAYAAAQHSNLRLLTWPEFQQMFAERWYRRYMAPTLGVASEALNDYTEPFNTKVVRRADALDADRQQRFGELRWRYAAPAAYLSTMWRAVQFPFLGRPRVPTLPLRSVLDPEAQQYFPDDVLEATELRPLMAAVERFYDHATMEFDAIFGGRT
jgi:hypothetical protein